jgi:hypothetical protein
MWQQEGDWYNFRNFIELILSYSSVQILNIKIRDRLTEQHAWTSSSLPKSLILGALIMGGNVASPWAAWFCPPLCNISSNNVGFTPTEPLLPVPLFPELITLLLTLLPTADTDTVDVAVFAAGEIGAKYVSDSLKGGITMFGSVISENQSQISN